MVTMLFISIIACLLVVYKAESQREDSRRLLLNDPEAISLQLLNLERRLNALEIENNSLKQLIHSSSGGTTFVRWGRKDCPNRNGTELVYSGITGGGPYQEKGNGVNNLCLPHDPDIPPSNFPTRLENVGMVANLYGAEYQFTYGRMAQDDDVPCAVCRVIDASSNLMIPAKNSCPVGWTLQYDGFLCGDYHEYSVGEYICIDEDPQYFEGRRDNLNGRLFYPVLTVCGSLPCPPYVNAQYITCAVCSK